jgi:glycosyltransferase involved in cell wall biosynthesis
MKVPASSVAIAQRADHLFMFKLFKRKVKTICLMHSDNLRQVTMNKNKFAAGLFKIMEILGLKKADRIVFNDQGTYRVYLKRYPWIEFKSKVVLIGIDALNFTPKDREKCRQELDIPINAKVMLIIARMEKEKNVGAAIKIVREELDIQNYYLLIVGTGTLENKLRILAKDIKITNVKFLGQVNYENVPCIISASDVVLMPSLFEAGPYVTLEALACGVPSVNTDVGRTKIWIGDSGCGAVVSEVDKEFADRVKEFLEPNPTLRKRCIERVKKFPSFQNTGEEMMKIIDGLG